MILLVLTSCSTSKDISTSGILQKRKYMKGWHLNIPERRHQERSASAAVPKEFLSPNPIQLPRTDAVGAYEPVTRMEQGTSAKAAATELDMVPAGSDVKHHNALVKQDRRRTRWVAAHKPQLRETQDPTSVTGAILSEAGESPLLILSPGGEGSGGTNTMAILGFIFSLLIPILGLIFSIIALGQIKRTGERGHGLALAGLIISILSIVIAIAILA